VEQSKVLSLEEIFNCFTVLVNTQEMGKRMESLRIPLEISLVRLSLPKSPAAVAPAGQPQVKEKVQTISAVSSPEKIPQRHLSSPEKEKPAVSSVKKEEAQPIVERPSVENKILVSLEQIAQVWHEIVQNTSKLKISIGNYLREGTPVRLLGNTLTVSFHKNRSLYKESLETLENRMMVERIIMQALNAEIKLNFVLSQENKSDDAAVNHPAFRSAMDTFNARLIQEEPHG